METLDLPFAASGMPAKEAPLISHGSTGKGLNGPNILTALHSYSFMVNVQSMGNVKRDSPSSSPRYEFVHHLKSLWGNAFLSSVTTRFACYSGYVSVLALNYYLLPCF